MMFGKNKEPQTTTAMNTSSAPVAHTHNKQEVTTLLSEGVRFEGNMFAPSNTRVDGEVKGNINGQSMLVIGDKGIINGDINAVDVLIYGQINGNVKCHKLDLKKGSKVNGDVFVEVFITEAGVTFNGRCIMEQPKKQNPNIPLQQQKIDQK